MNGFSFFYCVASPFHSFVTTGKGYHSNCEAGAAYQAPSALEIISNVCASHGQDNWCKFGKASLPARVERYACSTLDRKGFGTRRSLVTKVSESAVNRSCPSLCTHAGLLVWGFEAYIYSPRRPDAFTSAIR